MTLVRQDARAAGTSTLLRVALLLFALLPVATLALRAVAGAWRFPGLLPEPGSVNTLRLVFSDRSLWRSFATSLELALLTALVATVCGYAAGRSLRRASPGMRRLASVAAFLPVVAPPIALGVGLQVFALRLGLSGTVAGVVLAHVVPAAGYLTLYFLGVLSAYDASIEDEARTLGASRWQTFTRVTAPVLRARWGEAFALGALVSWGQLALTLLVGGGVVRTLPVELLSFVRAGDDRLAAAAALVLTLPPALAFALVQSGARRAGAIA